MCDCHDGLNNAAVELCNRIDEAEGGRWNSRILRDMLGRRDAQAVFTELMNAGEGQPGFIALMQAGRGDLTVEFLISSTQWADCFTPPVIDAAAWRLANWRQL